MYTPDERAALERLDAAIRDAYRAFDCEGIVTSWVVLSHHLNVDADGDDTEMWPRLYPPDGNPSHVTLGLIETARAAILQRTLLSES